MGALVTGTTDGSFGKLVVSIDERRVVSSGFSGRIGGDALGTRRRRDRHLIHFVATFATSTSECVERDERDERDGERDERDERDGESVERAVERTVDHERTTGVSRVARDDRRIRGRRGIGDRGGGIGGRRVRPRDQTISREKGRGRRTERRRGRVHSEGGFE